MADPTTIKSSKREQLHAQELANIELKLAEGKTLTDSERKLLDAATVEDEADYSEEFKIPGPGEYFKTIPDIAEEFGVTRQTVTHTWKQKGLNLSRMKVKGKGYSREQVLHWVQNTLGRGTKAETRKLTAQKERETELRCQLLEIKLAEAKGLVITIADYKSHLSRIAKESIRLLDTLPARLAPIVTAQTPAEAEVEIQAAIDEAKGVIYRGGK